MTSDFQQPNALAAAVEWLQGTLLGSLAVAVAVIAVAFVGFLLLTGRVDVRRAVQVILGCFILFGASSIAGGIMRIVDADGGSAELAAAPLAQPADRPAQEPAGVKASPYDPYAGAALPARR